VFLSITLKQIAEIKDIPCHYSIKPRQGQQKQKTVKAALSNQNGGRGFFDFPTII